MEGEVEPIDRLVSESKQEEEGTVAEISIHALNGSPNLQTMRVCGVAGGYQLQIMINFGSTHNFVDEQVVQAVRGSTMAIKPFRLIVVKAVFWSASQCAGTSNGQCKEVTSLLSVGAAITGI